MFCCGGLVEDPDEEDAEGLRPRAFIRCTIYAIHAMHDAFDALCQEQALARVSVREEHAQEVCEVHRTGPGHSKRAQIDAPWSVLPGRPRRRAASPVCADDVRQSIVKETHVRHRHVGRRGRNLRSASWRVGLDA